MILEQLPFGLTSLVLTTRSSDAHLSKFLPRFVQVVPDIGLLRTWATFVCLSQFSYGVMNF
jgi:hypothetical protein